MVLYVYFQFGGVPDANSSTPPSIPGVAGRIYNVLTTYFDTPMYCEDVHDALSFALYIHTYHQFINQTVPRAERDDVMAVLDAFLANYSDCSVRAFSDLGILAHDFHIITVAIEMY